MKPACKSLLYLTVPLVTWGTLVTVSSVRAQSPSITPDTTLGNENSLVITNVDVGKSIPSDRIDGGATRGKNLFHSFSKFDIDGGRGAYFSNPAGIENIISRVTGSNRSNILGTLGVLGNANLFFANPKGVIFGPNARLDVSGSFFASTSDSFTFDNGFEFSASNPQAPPMLTVNMPVGLKFRDNPGSITIGNDQVTNPTSNSVSVEVQPEKTLAFVGGDINLNGRRLRAPGGRIELGALAAEGVVGINNDFSLSFPENVARADVSMNAADVDVTSGDKGSISINANNINILSNSDLCAGIGADPVCSGLATNFGSVGSQAGNITLNALDTITISGSGSSVRNRVNTNAVGTGGDVNIKAAGSVVLNDGGSISASTFGQGNSGKININARDNVSFDNGSRVLSNSEGTGNAGNITVKAQDTISLSKGSFILSNVGNFQGVSAVGNVGDIQIEGRTVSVTDTSQIQAGFFSNTQGDSGSVSIKAKESVSFSGRGSGIRADAFSNANGDGSDVEISAQSFSLTDGAELVTRNEGNGNGGDITINVGSFSLTNGAIVLTSNEGIGNAGNITVKAQDTISISKGSLILSNIGNPQGVSAVGNVGDIQIEGRTVSVTDTSQIQAGFFSNTQGNPGSVSIKAKESVSFSGRGSGIRADVFSNANGDGSDVEISAQSFSLNDGAELVTSNQGNGNGGDIIINVGSLFLTNNSIITSDTFGAGNAGNIKLNVSDLIRISGTRSGIFANTRGDSTGNGGNISIDPKTVEILDGARISADSRGTGKPGNINIVSDELLLLRRGGTISTNATQDTDGGNIRINTGVLVALPKENSDISANANRGNGGRVDITAQGIFGIVPRDASTDFSDITTSSEFGISGTVTINNPEVDPTNGLVELPETVVDAKNQVAQNPCQQGAGSTFVATGRGGLPSSPTQDLSSGTVRVGLATPVVSNTTASNPTASQPKSTPTAKRFVPAQGWVFNSKGQVVLTAYAPNSTGVQRTAHKGLCKAR
ncbi:MAG: filamentous hemagglutinin N-terminal domain-containing protein [Calothrix sp. MO_192.B10]|nr:filamentous hemagglutinin N-terminal domain-containing protein [Calothrix sp. MO_192.B10]